jgi:hypothetical protein
MADIGTPRSRRTRPGLHIALEGTPRKRVSLCLNGLLEGTPTRPIQDVASQEVVCRSSKAHPGWQRWEKNTWEHAGVLYGLEISSHAGKTQRLRDGKAGKDCDRVKEDGIGKLAGRVALVHRRLHQRFDHIQAACKAFSSLRYQSAASPVPEPHTAAHRASVPPVRIPTRRTYLLLMIQSGISGKQV